MKTMIKLAVQAFIQALPSLIKAFKGMTPKQRLVAIVVTLVAAVVAAFSFAAMVHIFGYETVSQGIELFEEAKDALD